MILDLPHHFGTTMCCNGRGLNGPVALDEAKDNHFTGCTPASFALSMPTERGFVAFDGTGKRFTELFFVSAASTDETVKSFLGRAARIITKSLTIDRNTKGKKFNKATLGRFRKTT